MNTGFLGPAVATVLTVYGIETCIISKTETHCSFCKLQQYLPFTVLKLSLMSPSTLAVNVMLQQYLPFTVLKLIIAKITLLPNISVATVLTVYGIET